MMRAGVLAAAVVTLVMTEAPVRAGEIERLRAENQRLQQRVQDLEAENASLRKAEPPGARGLTAALETRATEAVTISPGEQPGSEVVETKLSRLEGMGGGRGRHWVRRHGQQGSGGARPDAVALVVDTSASGGQYRGVPVVRLVVDGAPLECSVTDYRSRISIVGRDAVGRTEDETITVRVPVDGLDRLTEAREVSGTLGSTSFRLTPQQLADLRAFAQRLRS